MNKFLVAVAVLAVLGGASAKCANGCSGHGTCGTYDRCTCYGNWQGSDCSQRTCSYGFAWVSQLTTAANQNQGTLGGPIYNAIGQAGSDAHYYAECSNKGICDRKTGECKCFDGYEGKACRRSTCPNDCSGHGTCEYIEELASLAAGGAGAAYSGWDVSKIQGCKCDVFYGGVDCSSRLCPVGNDPITDVTAEVKEVQTVLVVDAGDANAAGIDFFLTYYDAYGGAWRTRNIDSDASAADVEAALEALPNKAIDSVTVTRTGDGAAGTGYSYAVTFDSTTGHTTGDQVTLKVDCGTHGAGSSPVSAGALDGCTVVETTKGTAEQLPCSNRGLCDSSTGICECNEGYTDEHCNKQHVFI